MAITAGRVEPDGLPASRRIIHVVTVVVTIGCFWIGCTIAGYTDPASTQGVPQSSGADIARHVQQPHMQDYFGKLADLVEGDLEAEWLWPLSD